MEREVLLTGIGGQGVQLAARTLAVGAMRAGRQVMSFGTYGGAMRGGNTDATVVVADGPVRTPPTVTAAWFGLGMHHDYWSGVAARLRPGGIAIIDSTIFPDDLSGSEVRMLGVEASRIARDIGAPKAGSMVALGALAAATALVDVESLVAAAQEVHPPYRAKFAEANGRAIEAGAALFPESIVNAWSVLSLTVPT